MDLLLRIKRLVLGRRYRFSLKALDELDAGDLSEMDVVESIVNAVAVYKTLRSRSPRRGAVGEKLYVIISGNLAGVPIYTKGEDRAGRRGRYQLLPGLRQALDSGITQMRICECPTCGGRNVRRVVRDLTRTRRGTTFTVPAVAVEECPDCGEILLDHDAMRRIENCFPGGALPLKRPVRKKAQ